MYNSYRKTWLEIDLTNIYKNYLYFSKLLAPKKVIPVVKANAYGHGAIEVVGYLKNQGIDYFAVSLLEEAIDLRRYYKNIEILVMGVVSFEDVKIAAAHNITITVSQATLFDYIKTLKERVKFHLKIDTGMNRLGFKDYENAKKVYLEAMQYNHISIEGVYSHFATSDGDKTYSNMQKRRFNQFLESLPERPKMVHLSNTSGALKLEESLQYTTHARVGVGLYGSTLEEDITQLLPTYKLMTQIAEIKHLKKGEKLGYGITYEAIENETIGVLPVGYADGIIRKNQNGVVSINGKSYPIVGRICMDQMFIRIDDTITKADIITIFGDSVVSIDDVAGRLDTISYEVFCMITYRVPRVYKE